MKFKQFIAAVTAAVMSAVFIPSEVITEGKTFIAKAEEKTDKQIIDVLMDNYDVWSKMALEKFDSKAVGFLDIDFDNELELVVGSTAGSGIFTVLEFYKVNSNNIEKIKVQDNTSFPEIMGGSMKLYCNKDGVMEYYGYDMLKNGMYYHDETFCSFSYDNTNNCVTRTNYFSKTYEATYNSETKKYDEENYWYDNSQRISESEYNKLAEETINNLIDMNLTYSFVDIRELPAKDDIKQALIDSYNAFNYDGYNGLSFSDEADSNYIYNYDWEVEPKITADDIIVYNLEEKGYDHSIFNNLAYIKRDSKYGIIDYNGYFLDECTSEGYLITAPWVRQLRAGGLTIESGNGDFVYSNNWGGVGLEETFSYYSVKDKSVYKEMDLSHSICSRIESNDNELRGVRIAEFTADKKSNYKLKQDSIGNEWGIAKGNKLIVDCNYEAAITTFVSSSYSKERFEYYAISALKKDNKWCYVDKEGNLITQFVYNGCTSIPPKDGFGDGELLPFFPTEGFIAVKDDNGAGYIDTTGKEVIPTGTFAETRPVHDGKAWVKDKDTGLWGVIKIEKGTELEIKFPEIEEHIQWLNDNPDIFKNYDTTPELKELRDFLLKNKDVDDYKWLKNFKAKMPLSTDDPASNNTKEAVDLVIAEIINSSDFVNDLQQEGEIEFTKELYLTLNSMVEAFKNIDDTNSLLKDLREVVSKMQIVYNDGGGFSETNRLLILDYWNEIKGSNLITNSIKSLKEESIGIGLNILGIALESYEDTIELYQDYETYLEYSLMFEAQRKTLNTALAYLKDSLYESCNKFTDVKFYDELFSEYIAACDRISLDRDSILKNLLKEHGKIVFNGGIDIAKVMVKSIVKNAVKCVCPFVAIAWDMIDVGSSLILFVWENSGNIVEKATVRDICLNLLVFYDAIGNAMNDSFAKRLIQNKDLDSLELFEVGISIYRNIQLLLYEYLYNYNELYFKEISDAYNGTTKLKEKDLLFIAFERTGTFDYEQKYEEFRNIVQPLSDLYDIYIAESFWGKNNIELMLEMSQEQIHDCFFCPLLTIYHINNSNLNKLKVQTKNTYCCNPKGNNFIKKSIQMDLICIACPIDVIIQNGKDAVLQITNDKIVVNDETCDVLIVNEDDNSTATKIITYPSEYDIIINGNADGKMYISKITYDNNSIISSYFAADIPIYKNAVYTESTESDKKIEIAIDKDADGNTDSYAEVLNTKFPVQEQPARSTTTITSTTTPSTQTTTVISTSTVSQTTSHEYLIPLYGDANCDGSVTAADAVLIQQSLSDPEKYELTKHGKLNGDVFNSGDGITSEDADVIKAYVYNSNFAVKYCESILKIQ